MRDAYLARLACGCVISACEVSDDETDALWLYLTQGNGWTVERVDVTDDIDSECATCAANGVWQTQRMFA